MSDVSSRGHLSEVGVQACTISVCRIFSCYVLPLISEDRPCFFGDNLATLESFCKNVREEA